jgi:methionine-rich copper-binding protein CopC
LLGGAPAAAVARGGLVASDPGDQAVLAAAPRGVRLTFSGTPIVADSHVSIVDGDGEDVADGPLSTAPGRALWRRVAVAVPSDVTVAYHVEFEGGGETSGVLRFSVGTGRAPAPAGIAAPADPHAHRVDPLSAFLLVVDGLVVLGVLAMLWLRRPATPPF